MHSLSQRTSLEIKLRWRALLRSYIVRPVAVGQARDHNRLLPAVLLSEALRREVHGGHALDATGGRVE